MKRHGKAMRLVANTLNQPEGGRVVRQRDALNAIAREQQFLLLRDADRNQPLEAELLQRVVRGGELTFAAIDEDQIRKRAAVLERALVAAQHHFVHRGEVIKYRP